MITIFDCGELWEIWKHGVLLYVTDDKIHAMEMDEAGYVVVLRDNR